MSDRNMEFYMLSPEDQALVLAFVDEFRKGEQRGMQERILPDGRQLYAYPHYHGISWGINSATDGFNAYRGVFAD